MKKKFWKTLLALLLVLLMICGLLSGCNRNTDTENTITASDDTTSDGTVSLRVVTEKTGSFMMNDLTEDLIEAYEASHENVVIDLEILPTDPEARDIRVESLRTEIIAGKGPDVFLMPTKLDPFLHESDGELLFQNVSRSMYNGLFADISEYYDADTDLRKEELQATVMDSGVVGNERYVLPLRYTFETLLINEETLAKYDITVDEITGNIQNLVNTVLDSQDEKLICSISYKLLESMTMLPELINYETGEIATSSEEIAECFRIGRKITAVEDFCGDGYTSEDGGYYIENGGNASLQAFVQGYYWNDGEHPIFVGSLVDALHSYIVGKTIGKDEVLAYPMQTMDGSVIAEVTYWGAIGAGCQNVGVAYDFLSQFLSQEALWELDRSKSLAAKAGELYEDGYPVRIKGSVEPLTESLVNIASKAKCDQDPEGGKARFLSLKRTELIDTDFPLLDVEIDTARFPILWEEELLNNFRLLYRNNSELSDEQIDEMTADLCRTLEFYVAES